MKWRETSNGHSDQTKLISPRLNNGDWDYWLVIEVINWVDVVGEDEAPAKWHVQLSAVAPGAVNDKGKQSALQCYGIDPENAEWDNSAFTVEILSAYGISAFLWQESGDNLRQLLITAKSEANMLGAVLFGFAMDRPQNAIGTTGWDAISGNLLAPLSK